ncbi:MAG: hypothetical protein Ct9H90mP24_5390 [Methanobacteriota archaeon]|nr:MAG: hypothetical protein Ct9H90mP24_5390 [Euryarchaeota archaeon]
MRLESGREIGHGVKLLLPVGRLAAGRATVCCYAHSQRWGVHDSHLVIIGRGSLRGRLNRMATRLGIRTELR